MKLNTHYRIFIGIWTLSNIIILVIGFILAENLYHKILTQKGQSIVNSFQTIYNSELVQNGIYARVDSTNQPHQSLDFYALRDIESKSGYAYTLICPYHVVQKLYGAMISESETRMRIFSWDPLNEENYPNSWEAQLMNLTHEVEYYDDIYKTEDRRFYRIMSPMKAQSSCLKCHIKHKSNSLIGGVSFTIPMDDYYHRKAMIKAGFATAIFLLWLLGLFIILLSLRKLNKKINENTKSLKKLEYNEEKYRMLVNNISDVVWMMDLNMHFTYLSPSIEKLSGYTADEFMHLPLDKTLTKESYEKMDQLFFTEIKKIKEGKLEDIKDTHTLELEIIHKNGQVIHAEFKAHFNYDSQGEIVSIQGLTRDISERKRFTLKLEKSEKQLRELISTKDKFFSVIAHDLKNPFNSLLGFTELLSTHYDEYDDEKRLEFIQLIEKSANKGYDLLQNLLEWGRTQTGKIVFNPEQLLLKEEVDDCTELLKYNLDSKKIDLKNEIDEMLVVYADKHLLKTILHNLISNAIKFSNKKSTISVYAKTGDSMISIHVKDEGTGIKKENIDKLFRLDTSFSTEGTAGEKGTGLGLILCKELVEKNKGTITVESEYEAGSTFTFTLPKAKQ